MNDDGRNNNSNKSLIIFMIIHKSVVWIWDTSRHLVPFVLHFRECNIPTWVFFSFFKLYKRYQIKQCITGFRRAWKTWKTQGISKYLRKITEILKTQGILLSAIIFIILKCWLGLDMSSPLSLNTWLYLFS